MPRRTSCATPSCAGRRCGSAWPTPPCRATAACPRSIGGAQGAGRRPGGGRHHHRPRRRRPQNLLGFSDERLLRAVAAASTPVVSAIGHENDRPLLDDVADLRASTPTDAAKRVVPDVAEELSRDRAGAGAPRHAALAAMSATRSTGSGTCARVRRSPTPPGSSTRAPRSSPAGSRADASSSIARSSAQTRRAAELRAATCVPSRRRPRSTAATRSPSSPTDVIVRDRRTAPSRAPARRSSRVAARFVRGPLRRPDVREPWRRIGWKP